MSDIRPQVVAIVVAYNGDHLLAECLKTIRDGLCSGDAIFVFDNAGSDASRSIALGYGAEVVSSRTNLGFAGGVNCAVERWIAAHGPSERRLYVLVNPDCRLSSGWLDPLIKASDSPEVGPVGVRIFDSNAKVEHEGATIESNGLTRHRGGSGEVGPFVPDYVCGAVLAIREHVWVALGGFDEGYWPCYYEEVDLCLRARRSGFEVVCALDSEAFHDPASSSGGVGYLFYRRYHNSRMRFVIRHQLARCGVRAWITAELGWLLGLRDRRHVTAVFCAYPRLLSQALLYWTGR